MLWNLSQLLSSLSVIKAYLSMILLEYVHLIMECCCPCPRLWLSEFNNISLWWAAQASWLLDGPCSAIQAQLWFSFIPRVISQKDKNYLRKKAWLHSKTQGLHCNVLIWICWRLNIAFPFGTTGLYELV